MPSDEDKWTLVPRETAIRRGLAFGQIPAFLTATGVLLREAGISSSMAHGLVGAAVSHT